MGTQKIGDVVEKLFSKTSVSAEKLQAIVNALRAVEGEIDESDVIAINDSLMTEKEAETRLTGKLKANLEGKAKADVLGTLDNILSRFEHLLEGESKSAYEQAKTTYSKAEMMLNYLQERSQGGRDSEAYKKEYNKLKDSIDKDYIPKDKYDEISKQLNPAYEAAFNAKLLQKAHGHKGISGEAKESRRFDDNFLADFKDHLSAKGYKVDFKTGQVLDREGKPVLNGVDEINAFSLIDEVVQGIPEYQKKSEGSPQSGQIDIDVPKGTKGLSGAQNSNLDRMAGAND